MLYYPIAVGEFRCNRNYRVHRDRFDSFLGLCVIDGEMHLEQGQVRATAGAGEILLVDCFRPHTYYTETAAETVWMHFDGGESRKWFEEITNAKGQSFPLGEAAVRTMRQAVDYVRGDRDEYEFSSLIYAFLCRTAVQNSSVGSHEKQEAVRKAEEYIRANFDQPLTVEDIASQTHFSAPYFNKLFHSVNGSSPYDYLLKIRLEKAKELLLQTELPVHEVAEQTGFNSTSNFLCFFKKHIGFSALKFRKLRF
ncbi:MAG: helix-turn-helix transcriptional regulator [Clostridia bacterium]|nr:helix-turn-helix transcriptional regulator [Clostridia bacterium]